MEKPAGTIMSEAMLQLAFYQELFSESMFIKIFDKKDGPQYYSRFHNEYKRNLLAFYDNCLIQREAEKMSSFIAKNPIAPESRRRGY